MKMMTRSVLSAVVSLGFMSAAMAQVPPQPSMLPASEPTVKNAVVIAAAQGNAQYRLQHLEKADAGWTVARAGIRLQEGAELWTGMGDSAIQIRIGETQLYTITHNSLISLKQAIKKAGSAATTVGIDYGRMVIEVDSTRIANDVQIEAPDVTLAVTGTGLFIEVRPGFPTISGGMKGNTGRIGAEYANGSKTDLAGEEQSDSKSPDPAEHLVQVLTVETSNGRARETDEKSQAERSSGAGDSTTISLGFAPSSVAGNTQVPAEGELIGGDTPPPPPPPPPPPADTGLPKDPVVPRPPLLAPPPPLPPATEPPAPPAPAMLPTALPPLLPVAPPSPPPPPPVTAPLPPLPLFCWA